MIRMVVFDMAGTAVNEGNLVYRTLQRSISAAGYPVALPTVLAQGAGKEKLQAVQDILALPNMPVAPPATAHAIHRQFRHDLSRAYRQLEVTPFAGVVETLEALHRQGTWVVFNTGYDRATACLLLERLGWAIGREIDLLVTASEVARNRPHPDMILHAMQRLRVPTAQTVAKIGDSRVDVEEGKNAGCGLTVGITTGAQSRQQLAQACPDHIIDHMSELPKLLGL